jgi:argininosuccinate synthase
MTSMAKRVVLAYSGGLDTSVAVRWMIEHMGVEVVCLSADVGQEGTLEGNREKALGAGAIAYEQLDLRAEFAELYVAPVVKANALYEDQYPLVSALSRPLIVAKQVELARRYGADALAHGCTGKGNDQVRFEVSAMALAPDLEMLAPVRNWGFTREDSIRYAADHGIPVTATKEKMYSIDDNLWGRAIECGEMEDPWRRPPEGVWKMTVPTASAPSELVLGFERGVPIALDGRAMPLHELIVVLNHEIGSYGWGRLDMVENRRVGIKSRETYEAPGALAIMLAHADLESITLERDLQREKIRLQHRYAELVYDGLWFSPLREALDAFVDTSQEPVTGEVRLRLEPGRCFVVGRRSPHSLYDYGLATYDAADRFRHADSEGFVRLWGLGVQTWSGIQGPGSRS